MAEVDAGPACIALGRRNARLGHAHHQVGIYRRLFGERLSHPDTRMVDALPVEDAVGPGEVDELEETETGIDLVVGERVQRPAT